MRLVIAQMKHETNTFSPVRADLHRFARGLGVPREGADAVAAFRGTGTALGAFIELAEQAGAEFVLPIAASAWPSGPADMATFEAIADKIVSAVRPGCDAVLLDLHGAMVTDRYDDAEAELLTRLRAVAPDVPIGIAFDMHANVSHAVASMATTIAGYQTYPHVDMAETGLRAGHPILSLLSGTCRPVMAYGSRPMLPHVMRQSSLDSPNREIQARARQMESDGGALAASLFVGFPHADVACAGLSAIVVTDDDPWLARKYVDELLELAWETREEWVYVPEPLELSLGRCESLRPDRGPIVLLDHYDNCSSGGTMDTMAVLAAVLDRGLEDVVFFAIYDPGAVRKMDEAGVGSTITLDLGGKIDMPALGLRGEPRRVTGVIEALVDGVFRNHGPMGKGERADMGRSAVLRCGGTRIVVISKQVEPNDLACFHTLGIDPTRCRYLVLKSRVHWRAGLGDIASAVVECAGIGVCTSDYSQLRFENLGREVYPLTEF